MNATKNLLEQLQVLLTDELTALDLYSPHRGFAAARGYGTFVGYIDERIGDERKHADMLVKRIYELEGTPDTVARNSLPEQTADLFEGLMQDRQAEIGAIIKYNVAIATAVASGDNATRDILAGILADEDDHLLDIERRLIQITQVTRPQWLSLQIG